MLQRSQCSSLILLFFSRISISCALPAGHPDPHDVYNRDWNDYDNGAIPPLPSFQENPHFYQPPEWLDDIDSSGDSTTQYHMTTAYAAPQTSSVAPGDYASRHRNRALCLARRKFDNPNLQIEEWEQMRASGSAEAKAIVEEANKRIRDSTLRCRLRRRLLSNPRDQRALRTLSEHNWTLEDLELTRYAEPQNIKMSHERREAVKKQISLLRGDIKEFIKDQKVMDTVYFTRQRPYKVRDKDYGKAEDAVRARADQEAEEMIQKVKDTRYIFRKWAQDPRLPGLIAEINKWMQVNMKGRYKLIVLPDVSFLPVQRTADAGSSRGLTMDMDALDINNDARFDQDLEHEDIMTQIIGDDEDNTDAEGYCSHGDRY